MASPVSIPTLQKGSPQTLRSAARANELIDAVNQLRAAQIRVAPGPSRIDVAEQGVTITVGGDDILRFLRSGGYIA